MEPISPLLTPGLVEFIQGEVSLYLATRDEALRPRGSRVWAARVENPSGRITIFGHPDALQAHLASLESNGQMALCLARPSDDNAYQLKGHYLGHRACRKADRAYIETQVQRLFRNLERIGIPLSTFASWRVWPAAALTMQITDVYCQTPGPRAGKAVA